MELFKETNFDFLGKKWPFIIVSLLLIALGLGSMVWKGGIKWGIDFTGGALMYVRFRPPACGPDPFGHREGCQRRFDGSSADGREQ